MSELTCKQKILLKLFYAYEATTVVYDKSDRTAIWDLCRQENGLGEEELEELAEICPAMKDRIDRGEANGRAIQSAVFSECVYAQTFANMFGLNNFICYNNDFVFPNFLSDYINNISMTPRYIYYNDDRTEILIQAGSCRAVDALYVKVNEGTIYCLEFKEPWAKAAEHDLPRYTEEGNMGNTDDFLRRYPEYNAMLQEQADINFFNQMGHNIGDFSQESIEEATRLDRADFILTEDKDGYLTLIPAKDAPIWADLQGEIRTAGRNAFDVWTPIALERFLNEKDAQINNAGLVTINIDQMDVAVGRGGDETSRYKINPLFFVPVGRTTRSNGNLIFQRDDVRQLKPTIATKLNFKYLRYSAVKNYYICECEN